MDKKDYFFCHGAVMGYFLPFNLTVPAGRSSFSGEKGKMVFTSHLHAAHKPEGKLKKTAIFFEK